jgi:hypothetical protein
MRTGTRDVDEVATEGNLSAHERKGRASRVGRRHLLLLVPVAALLVGLASWAGWRFLDDPFWCGLSGSETVAWAGSTVDDQVEVSEVSSDCWLDRSVYFTIRGTPAAVDEVLEASDFKGEFAPGFDFPVQASLFDESVVAELQSVESAVESADPSGDGWVSRQVVRGTLDGETVLLVAAYST